MSSRNASAIDRADEARRRRSAGRPDLLRHLVRRRAITEAALAEPESVGTHRCAVVRRLAYLPETRSDLRQPILFRTWQCIDPACLLTGSAMSEYPSTMEQDLLARALPSDR